MSKQNLTRRGFLKGVTAGSTGVALLSLPPEAATHGILSRRKRKLSPGAVGPSGNTSHPDTPESPS